MTSAVTGSKILDVFDPKTAHHVSLTAAISKLCDVFNRTVLFSEDSKGCCTLEFRAALAFFDAHAMATRTLVNYGEVSWNSYDHKIRLIYSVIFNQSVQRINDFESETNKVEIGDRCQEVLRCIRDHMVLWDSIHSSKTDLIGNLNSSNLDIFDGNTSGQISLRAACKTVDLIFYNAVLQSSDTNSIVQRLELQAALDLFDSHVFASRKTVIIGMLNKDYYDYKIRSLYAGILTRTTKVLENPQLKDEQIGAIEFATKRVLDRIQAHMVVWQPVQTNLTLNESSSCSSSSSMDEQRRKTPTIPE